MSSFVDVRRLDHDITRVTIISEAQVKNNTTSMNQWFSPFTTTDNMQLKATHQNDTEFTPKRDAKFVVRTHTEFIGYTTDRQFYGHIEYTLGSYRSEVTYSKSSKHAYTNYNYTISTCYERVRCLTQQQNYSKQRKEKETTLATLKSLQLPKPFKVCIFFH